MSEKTTVPIHIQYIFGFWDGNRPRRFLFSNKCYTMPSRINPSKRWAQKFWCTFPPSPLFVLLRFLLHTHWVSVFHPFHTHTVRDIIFILFSFLRHDVIERSTCTSVCVCVYSVHLFILQYLSGAKVFLFIFDVTVYTCTCCTVFYHPVDVSHKRCLVGFPFFFLFLFFSHFLHFLLFLFLNVFLFHRRNDTKSQSGNVVSSLR